MLDQQMEVFREDLKDYIDSIINKIDEFLNKEIEYWKKIDDSISAPLIALTEFFHGGGKRLRPSFCLLGYKSQNGKEINQNIIDAGCALELLHNFALVHDDFMDRADTRRGIPTVHKFLESYYSTSSYTGDIEHFANSVAILAGDFAFTYADRFARTLSDECLDVYDLLKVELFAGQQMDLDAVYRQSITKENISLIAQYKSGKYTIERPLQLGALLANKDADPRLWEDFGSPLGEAFQLRDDVLGIYGDTVKTGKPVGDDIREGKFTLLISESLDLCDEKQRNILNKRGNADLTQEQIDEIVEIIKNCGALEKVENRINDLYTQAIKVLDEISIDDESKTFAQYLAKYVCWRES
ncbi:MAG: polyprenyl synthetase family protein [Acidimicrobiia bacterium]